MKRIFYSISQLAGMQFVIALTGIARNKVLALKLGPEIFGEFTQIAVTIGILYTLASFGMGVGLSRNVAAASSLLERQRLLAAANFLVMVLAVTASILVGCIALTGNIAHLFPMQITGKAMWVVSILSLLTPIEVLKNNYLAFLQGALDIKGISSRRSLAIILSTLISLPIVWFFGILGAAIQTVLLTSFVTFMLGRRCYQLGYDPLRIAYNKQAIVLLGSFGIASLLSGFAQNFSDVAVRTALIDHLGAIENGFYQAALVLSQNVKTIILGSIGSYSISAIAQHQDRQSMTEATNKLLSVVLPVATVAIGLLGTLCYPAVSVLYSASFANAKHYFPLLLSGDFIETCIWVVGAPLLALGHKKLWLSLVVGNAVMVWMFARVLIPHYGGQGVVLGYVVSLVVYLSANLFIYLKKFQLGIEREHVVSFCLGLAMIFGLSSVGSIADRDHYYPMVIACILWIIYVGYIIQTRVPVRIIINKIRSGIA